MEIRLPQLAEGVDSATVVNILVSEGAKIRRDQSIMELETEKAVGTLPSPADGTVTKIHVKEGDEVAIGQLLISLTEEGLPDRPIKKTERDEKAAETPAASPEAVPVREGQRAETEEGPREDFRYEPKPGFAPPASPSIRKLAAELGIDLTRVEGSERGGRITLHDLRGYIQRLQAKAEKGAPAPPADQRPVREPVDFSKWGPVRRERLSSLRRTVAKRMLESWSTIPHITQFDEADITSLLELKKRFKTSPRTEPDGVTVTSFILKAAVRALKKYPVFNSSLDESAGEIVYKEYYHLNIAVDTEAGLIVPVIKDVDRKDMIDLSRELAELTRKARERKVSLEELQGGTFTISNQGSIGGAHFTPIIYKPQVAILGLGRSAWKPLAKEDGLKTGMVLPLCLSYDHRVIDGAQAVRFLIEIVRTLENFEEWAVN